MGWLYTTIHRQHNAEFSKFVYIKFTHSTGSQELSLTGNCHLQTRLQGILSSYSVPVEGLAMSLARTQQMPLVPCLLAVTTKTVSRYYQMFKGWWKCMKSPPTTQTSVSKIPHNQLKYKFYVNVRTFFDCFDFEWLLGHWTTRKNWWPPVRWMNE